MSQKAKVRLEENGFIRITIPAKFTWKLGQHCFLRFTNFGLLPALSAHPFTICSLPSSLPNGESELVFYIRQQDGFTARLNQYALEHPGVSVPVLIDGPYGGISLQKYYESDHLLVIAGGSGAGWCLPFIDRFIRYGIMPIDKELGVSSSIDAKADVALDSQYRTKQSGPLSLRIVLATRDVCSRVWFLRSVGELLSKHSTADPSSIVRVQVYLTGEAAKNGDLANKVPNPTTLTGFASPGDKIHAQADGREATALGEEFEGRPQLPAIIQEEAAKVAEAGDSLGVFVCGPATMQSDVRNAVAEANLNILKGSKASGIYLHSEHFSWA